MNCLWVKLHSCYCKLQLYVLGTLLIFVDFFIGIIFFLSFLLVFAVTVTYRLSFILHLLDHVMLVKPSDLARVVVKERIDRENLSPNPS